MGLEINEKTIELLKDLYYIQHNYDSADNLYKKAKNIDKNVKKEDVKLWLSKQQTKQITTVKTGKKSFLPIYSEMPYAFQIDLTFFPRYKKQNNNNYVLFTAINVNTRYAYAFYGKDKEMDTILDMLKKMEEKTVINSITCDEGSEFTNNRFVKFCSDKKIRLFFVKEDSHKLGIVNRFHRTLKEKITKYFIATDKLNWIDVIDKIIYNYNHTINTGIGIEPAKVDAYLEHEIITFKREITDIMNKKDENETFKTGDRVRILNTKVLFQDKMLPKYSAIVYTVLKTYKNACLLQVGKEELRVKNDQLIKSNIVDNEKEIVQIPKLLKEQQIEKKIKKEKLEPIIVDRPKRERKPNKKYLD